MVKPYEGSQIVAVRVPAALLASIDADVERSVQHDNDPRASRSAWVLHALAEVFRHRKRAKQARKRQQASKRAVAAADSLAASREQHEEERE